MTHLLVMYNNCVKYYPDPTLQWGVTAWTRILGMCTVTLTLEIWPWVKVMTHPWVMDDKCLNIIQIQLCSEELWPGNGFWVCALWPWPWRYDLGSRSWHTLGSCTIIVLNIIQIGQVGTELWIRHEVNRRTDRQTGQGDSFIPPKLCRGGGGYKNRCKW